MHEFKVDGMGCASCVTKIATAVRRLDPDAAVEVDRADGRVRVGSDLGPEKIAGVIAGLGFRVRPPDQ